ncbi:MAG: hypothetical protein NZ455_07540 [Bacteroidia bacterium]|nr:hypothetical protein [Bacteroidia bacterium]MDW8346417.1 hypothetical protein [Bacteroidia bacterium]
MREACGGCVSSAQRKRSTEAIAQPAARRPCPHERKRAVGKDTPKVKN